MTKAFGMKQERESRYQVVRQPLKNNEGGGSSADDHSSTEIPTTTMRLSEWASQTFTFQATSDLCDIYLFNCFPSFVVLIFSVWYHLSSSGIKPKQDENKSYRSKKKSPLPTPPSHHSVSIQTKAKQTPIIKQTNPLQTDSHHHQCHHIQKQLSHKNISSHPSSHKKTLQKNTRTLPKTNSLLFLQKDTRHPKLKI